MSPAAMEDLDVYTDEFDVESINEGSKAYLSGAVQHLEIDPDRDEADAVVSYQNETCEVWLLYNRFDGWMCGCTGDDCFDQCKHVYAVILAWENLGKKPSKVQKVPVKAPSSSVLGEVFQKTKGAALSKKERRAVEGVYALYNELLPRKSLPNVWMLSNIGVECDTFNWGTLDLWDEFPENDHVFWLYIVAYCRKRNGEIPKELEPVSDVSLLADRILQMERRKIVNHWHAIFRKDNPGGISGAGTLKDGVLEKKTVPLQLRLKFLKDKASLESNRADHGWIALTRKTAERMKCDLQEGRITMSADDESLFGRLQDEDYRSHYRISLGYDHRDEAQSLISILMSPNLRAKCVDKSGNPFQFNHIPLVWAMSPKVHEGWDGFEFFLEDSKGKQVEQSELVLTGNPTLYKIGNVWNVGPTLLDQLFPFGDIRFVPKEVVESSDGVRFFHHSGVNFPSEIQDRIQTQPLHPVLRCRLDGPSEEECLVEVFAANPDGELVQSWSDGSWLALESDEGAQVLKEEGASKSDHYVIYDESQLAGIPSVMDPLRLRMSNPYDHYGFKKRISQFRKKVTNAFPKQFFDWLEYLPEEVEVRLEGVLESFRKKSVTRSVSLSAEENDIDWFDVQLVTKVEDTELTEEEVQLLMKAKGKWVRMGEKGWRRMLYQVSEEDSRDLAKLGVSPESMGSEPQRFHALQLANPVASRFLPEKQAEAIRKRGEEIQTSVQPKVPSSIKADMRSYQVDGFHFLAYLSTNQFGGILADDMGLGKTLQTLAWLEWLRAKKGNKKLPSLVVCPKSVMDNWRAEAEKFVKGLKVRVWNPKELDQFASELSAYHLHVINYNQLRSLGEPLAAVQFLSVILDEGQYIKNPSSQSAQIARALNASYRLVLTGTPIENRLLDLWSLMAFSMPGILGSRNQFGKLYNAKDDPFARLRLSSRVRPFLIRRTKSQVANDLPDRIEEDIVCEMEGEQEKLYKAEQKRAQQLLLKIKSRKELNELRFNILTSLLRLRQICCHPKLIRASSKADSAKTEALLEQLEPIMEEGNKVLVFSQFVEVLDLLEKQLKKQKWKTWKLTGKTEGRGSLVDSFQSHDGAGVFLISLKAGGSGLNLTAASYVVLFDPWWNPAVENQAIDRTHRIGQTNKVIAYRLLIKNSIEEKIRALQKTKKSMAEDVLGEEKFSESLSLEDFEFLFS